MSVQQVILNLISGISDPADRMEIARTINMIYQAFISGRANEDEVRRDLLDIVKTVLKYKDPFLPKEEIDKRANEIVNNLMLSFKLRKFGRSGFKKYFRF